MNYYEGIKILYDKNIKAEKLKKNILIFGSMVPEDKISEKEYKR